MRKPIDRPREPKSLRRVETSARCGYRQVLWDWNGTLLDDRDYAIGVRNRVFPRFGLPPIASMEEYHRQFTFPVRVYYERAGVTEALFPVVANAWMEEYVRGGGTIPLHGQAVAALEAFRSHGLSQAILSASQVDILEAQLAQYGIREYFQEVLGLDHIYATGKAALGLAYLRRLDIPPQACALLGDTLHDAQVARDMGVDCFLIAQGHQGPSQLEKAGVPVCATLAEAVDRVLGTKPRP